MDKWGTEDIWAIQNFKAHSHFPGLCHPLSLRGHKDQPYLSILTASVITPWGIAMLPLLRRLQDQNRVGHQGPVREPLRNVMSQALLQDINCGPIHSDPESSRITAATNIYRYYLPVCQAMCDTYSRNVIGPSISSLLFTTAPESRHSFYQPFQDRRGRESI